jgi:hypothetical protein
MKCLKSSACKRRESIAADLRPQGMQPEGEPGAFEAGVAGHEHAFALIDGAKHHQTFQGALPLSHILLSISNSR